MDNDALSEEDQSVVDAATKELKEAKAGLESEKTDGMYTMGSGSEGGKGENTDRNTPIQDRNGGITDDAPQTGDGTILFIWSVLIMAALAALGYILTGRDAKDRK